jgi:hypothetical protein
MALSSKPEVVQIAYPLFSVRVSSADNRIFWLFSTKKKVGMGYFFLAEVANTMARTMAIAESMATASSIIVVDCVPVDEFARR